MQIGKMADYNLLLAPIPKDTGKSEPINQKKTLKLYLHQIWAATFEIFSLKSSFL